jgi:hypothetical protein
MSAHQSVLQFREAPAESQGVNSRCLMCNGTGWRVFMIDARGDRRVRRCECVAQRREVAAVPVADYKAAAAGER